MSQEMQRSFEAFKRLSNSEWARRVIDIKIPEHDKITLVFQDSKTEVFSYFLSNVLKLRVTMIYSDDSKDGEFELTKEYF